MSYTYHVEFVKEEEAIHPQSGELMARTILDAYFYGDAVIVWGWGTFDQFSFNVPQADPVARVIEALTKQGFTVLSQSAGSGQQ